mmetsp:Transcript_55277/g.103655  ORF Transcript_55277/g.103655 Transcript_55277/m.103655 type:complete len:238 (+) Transcript_55277:771-1484(+)
MRHRLTCVQQHLGTHRMGSRSHLLHGIDAAEGVGDMHEGHHLGAGAQQTMKLLHVKDALIGDANMLQGCPGPLGGQLPWYDVGVVLHHCDQHFVARSQILASPTFSHEIDRICGPTGEDYLLRTSSTNQGGHRAASMFEGLGCSLRQRIGATMDIGRMLIVFRKRSEDTGRLLRRGARIEVDQRYSWVSLRAQGWEVASHLISQAATGTCRWCRRGLQRGGDSSSPGLYACSCSRTG